MPANANPILVLDHGDIALRLIAAVLVGALVGLDRELRGKPAGLRTLALVSLGAALVCVSTIHTAELRGEADAMSRVIQGIIQGVLTGIGFIGAGVVLHRGGEARGLTTAAAIWVTAALGIACGLATWTVVLIGIGLTLFVLVILNPIDEWLERRRDRKEQAQNESPKST